MKQEVDKLIAAGFIREVMYLVWLTNVVMVKKNNASGGYMLTLWI